MARLPTAITQPAIYHQTQNTDNEWHSLSPPQRGSVTRTPVIQLTSTSVDQFGTHAVVFLRATACNAIARLCYGRGVLPSVTLLYCVKKTQLRIMKSSLWATARTLVSKEVILLPLGEEIPLERGHQRGVTPLEIVILPLLAHLA